MAMLPLQLLAVDVSHCVPPTRAVFSCSTGTKTVSVCQSPDLTASSGVLQYRFGRPPLLDLSYPPAGADWRAVTRGGTLTYSGGGGAFLAFTNASYRYIVYSKFGKIWGTKAGVVVEKDGKRIASLACKGEPVSELGPGLFEEANIKEAEFVFEPP
jgi:hypothetical protein